MTGFHFSFDLAHAGLWAQNFYHDPFWRVQRTIIVSLFLLCAGAGQGLAVAQKLSWARFVRRWLKVVLAALAVSVGSWWMFPKSFIYFGVLHGMAVMLVLVRFTAGMPARWLWLMGGVAIASKFIAAYILNTWASGQIIEFFNAPGPNALGWISHLPVTEDYVPLAPWLGVMWWGAAVVRQWPGLIGVVSARLGGGARALAALGRHSLPYYLLHQPVLLAGLWAWQQLRAPGL
jgi:uncharacterized membrane protein